MDRNDVQKLIEIQQQQLEAQNKLIADMQAQNAAREKAYEELVKQFGNVGVSQLPLSAPPKKKKSRASTGSIPHQPPVSTPSTSKKKIISKPKTPTRPKTTAPPPPQTPLKKPSLKRSPSTPKGKGKQPSGPPTPKPTPKRSPYQFQVKDMPEEFNETKVRDFF